MEEKCTHLKYIKKYFCFSCNRLICEICVATHKNFIHRDVISEYLTNKFNEIFNNKNNNDNDNDNNNNKNNKISNYGSNILEQKLQDTWSIMKTLAQNINSLELNQKDVADQFTQLHHDLSSVEFQIKKDINNDITTKRDLLAQYYKELASYFNIMAEENNIKEDQIENSDDDDDDNGGDDSDNSNNRIFNANDDTFNNNLKVSIEKSANLNQFIKVYNADLFDQRKPDIDNNIIAKEDEIYILELLFKHFNQHKNESFNQIKNSIKQYNLVLDQSEISQFKRQLPNLMSLSNSIQTNQQLSTYLLISKVGGLQLINITQPTNITINDIHQKDDFKFTYNSFVKASDIIYIFGGTDNPLSQDIYYEYNITKGRLTDHEMKNVDTGSSISVCYDGDQYIYLVNGYNNNRGECLSRIYRFNITTKEFNKCEYGGINLEEHNHILSFFYRNKMYSLAFDPEYSLYCYDVENNQLSLEKEFSEIIGRIAGACYDEMESIYIHTTDHRFLRYNLNTEKLTCLNPIYQALNITKFIYHKPSSSRSVIYVLGGKDMNYVYSIEENTWSRFFEEDQVNRVLYGAQLFQK